MRAALAAVAVLSAAASLLVGCGGSGSAAPSAATPGGKTLEARSGWASAAELHWLRSYGVWQDQIADYATRAEQSNDITTVTAALTALSGCGQLLRNDVGSAPTERLQRVVSLLESACADWRRAGLSAMKARGGAVASIRRLVRRASRAMATANTLLPPGENQPLARGAPSRAQSRVVPLFSRAATKLARRSAEVRCWTHADWNRLVREEREVSVSRVDRRAAGITSIASARENLRPEICARLGALARGQRPTDARGEMEDAFALLVLAHESQHASGVTSEVLADCRGMQTMRRVGMLLGLSSEAAQRLAEDYWRIYPQQPKIYVSRECRDGGRLDMRPTDRTWP